jgi:hypothetical protein
MNHPCITSVTISSLDAASARSGSPLCATFYKHLARRLTVLHSSGLAPLDIAAALENEMPKGRKIKREPAVFSAARRVISSFRNGEAVTAFL